MYERNIEEIPFVIREYYGIIAESLILKPFNSREIKYKREFESIRLHPHFVIKGRVSEVSQN